MVPVNEQGIAYGLPVHDALSVTVTEKQERRVIGVMAQASALVIRVMVREKGLVIRATAAAERTCIILATTVRQAGKYR